MPRPAGVPLATAAPGRLGTIARIAKDGSVWVHDGDRQPIVAHTLLHVSRVMLHTAVRRRLPVILADVVGSDRPVITGVLADGPSPQVLVDGHQVEITGEREVVLRCGKSSITLTRAGQIVLRGECIRSQANGPQVIQGRTVDIN